MPSLRFLLLALLCGLTLAACGGGDVDAEAERLRDRAERVRERADDVRRRAYEVRTRAREVRTRAERLRDRVVVRMRRVLEDLEKVVPEAGPQTRAPSAQGRERETEVDRFLTDVLESVDGYWTTTLTAGGMKEPRVNYSWVPPGDRLRTRCGAVADDSAAFYCPADDTIYVAQVFAAELYRGVSRGLPGQSAGYGRAAGDFGVAYIVAHEYAHNLQNEFGSFRFDRRTATKPLELQADCMAGLWGNSVYREGRYDDEDVREAMNTALAVGDFDYGNENHHGTPQERLDAWVLGFRGGDPADCRAFTAQ